MANLEKAGKRIIGVRTRTAGEILFCEAEALSPALGDWVMVERDSLTFPAQVALPDSLLEAHQLSGPLPVLLRMAEEADLAAAGLASALETQAVRRFNELVAASNLPYRLIEARFSLERLEIWFSADQEPTVADYVLLLKGLAETCRVRVELFRESEGAAILNPPTGENFGAWVNSLLVELDPAIMAKATVGEPLLHETAVYRPGHRPPAPTQPATPAAVYDPATATFSIGGVLLDLPDRGNN